MNRCYWGSFLILNAIFGVKKIDIRRLGAFRPDAQVCHFRSHSGYEVDFVVETSDILLGIEVKAGGRINPRELKGLESLLNIEPNCLAGIAVYAGKEILRLGERLWAVPAGNFLE